MKNLVILICFLVLSLPVATQAGEIRGKVTLESSSVPNRAKNKNPNRKRTVKKYGLKELRKAQAGGKGGLPSGEVVDERDYAVIFLTQDKDGAKLGTVPRTIEVRQLRRRFLNHVTAVPLGSKVKFTNKDKFFHHIYCPKSTSLNVPEHRGDVERKPKKLGEYELFCDIHPRMNGFLYVVPNDKFSLAKAGTYSLTGVPAGQYTLKVWHPRLPASTKQVTVTAAGVSEVNLSL